MTVPLGNQEFRLLVRIVEDICEASEGLGMSSNDIAVLGTWASVRKPSAVMQLVVAALGLMDP